MPKTMEQSRRKLKLKQMKKQVKKLSLNQAVVAKLNSSEMKAVQGGTFWLLAKFFGEGASAGGSDENYRLASVQTCCNRCI